MPKTVDHPARRAGFAEAAITTIAAHGIETLRLRDVAAAANATTGGLTHYFDGKEALLEAALDAIMERLVARMEALPAPAADVEALVDSVAATLPLDEESQRDWSVWLAFWGRAVGSPRLRAAHRAHYARIHARLLAAGLDRAGADALIAAVDGVGTRATLEPEDWPPARQRDTLARLIRPLLS